MTIEALLKVAPPPARPDDAFDGPWERVEAELGTRLPQDYKDFARLYGSGLFMNYLQIAIPESTIGPSLKDEVVLAYQVFETKEDFPYVVWPNRQGVLAFGSSIGNDVMFWLRVGPPDAWPVVIWDRSGITDNDCELLDCDFSGFLTGLVTGERIPTAFQPGLHPCDALFEPWSARRND